MVHIGARMMLDDPQMSFAALWPPLPVPPRMPRRALRSRLLYEQLPIIWPTPDEKLSPITQGVLDQLKRVARAAQPIPTNLQMTEILRCGHSSVHRAIQELEKRRIIRVEVERGRRRAHLLLVGTVTGWGEFQIGHAPFTRRPRGSPAPEPKARMAPIAQPLPPQIPRLPGPVLTAHDACQWPMWEGPLPRFTDPPVCGAPTAPRQSWCLCHLELVFPKRKRA